MLCTVLFFSSDCNYVQWSKTDQIILVEGLMRNICVYCTMMSYMIANDVIHVWWCCIMYLSSKTETTEAGVKKIKTSANSENVITEIFLMIQYYFVLFCLIWFFMSHLTIFQLCWEGSNWVEQVLSRDCVLLKDTKQCPWWGLNPQPLDLKPSTLPLIQCALNPITLCFVHK